MQADNWQREAESCILTPEMPHAFAHILTLFTTVLAVAGMGYFVAAMLAARLFLAERRAPLAAFAPGVSLLKSLKGLDPGMIDAFRSHCRQSYAGEFELLFGVATLDDPAVAAVRQLIAEFPERSIRLVVCPERLGTNGKVSTLVQLAAHARCDFLLINDSDITVSPRYLERVMACFASNETSSSAYQAPEKLDSLKGTGFSPYIHPANTAGALAPEEDSFPISFEILSLSAASSAPAVGLVTALYRGHAHGTLPSRLEALGIATDFQAGVLLSKWIEGGLHYGLGSTLAVRREALAKIGGLQLLVDHLADDYELGARVSGAGFRIALSPEVVETNIAAYGWRGYLDHQLRWARTVRDARFARWR
ncbi:MAG: glycosyltransferase [Terracidiphilus sp.]